MLSFVKISSKCKFINSRVLLSYSSILCVFSFFQLQQSRIIHLSWPHWDCLYLLFLCFSFSVSFIQGLSLPFLSSLDFTLTIWLPLKIFSTHFHCDIPNVYVKLSSHSENMAWAQWNKLEHTGIPVFHPNWIFNTDPALIFQCSLSLLSHPLPKVAITNLLISSLFYQL